MAIAALFLFASMPCIGDVLTGGIYEVYHEPQDAALAESTLQTLIASQTQFEDEFPNTPQRITVHLCASYDEFAVYAGHLATQSIVGVAKLNEDVIAIKTPGIAPQGADYTGTLRHELVHILLHHNVNTDNVPRWLNEGIAMVLSGENRWASRATVASMYLNGRTLSYRELEASFLEPGQEMEFGEAYAQAYSMTQYLMRELGEGAFWPFVRSLNSRSFGEAVEAELGQIPHDFAVSWNSSLGWSAIAYSVVSGLSAFQIMAILTIWAYLRRRRHALTKLKQWESEEADDETATP
ncbi:MAG: hypothetical protein SGI88_07175 [Candidatus Hydrogenedentes bacterium]|nr:hypothetical protein [Candidatus Hydrogenedentota bacterium]